MSFLSDSPTLQEIFQKYKAYICDETLITKFKFQSDGENFIFGAPVSEETLKVEDRFGMLVVNKISK